MEIAELLVLGAGAVSYAEARAMTPGDRLCIRVALGRARGGKFDWPTLRWSKNPEV